MAAGGMEHEACDHITTNEVCGLRPGIMVSSHSVNRYRVGFLKEMWNEVAFNTQETKSQKNCFQTTAEKSHDIDLIIIHIIIIDLFDKVLCSVCSLDVRSDYTTSVHSVVHSGFWKTCGKLVENLENLWKTWKTGKPGKLENLENWKTGKLQNR
ncbi:uncharacterized protein V6R79_005653 [Siganus canaliculatus]